ncbi:ATP-binding protein [Streptomyces stackebrandtii]|uniref:ATP-binding protein n=1 Tax=Streptomyces stackebrandtii TaxID=3051177 RepID=UPI0028DC8538|nr:AAA family ATPase [Streptomyces sp. DSM 40976]
MARFYGRDEELTFLHTLFARAQAGHGGVLTVCGEPGIGKTTLLKHALATVSKPVEVLWASGSQWETDFAYATLHQLCGPLLVPSDDDSGRHLIVLQRAFGFRDGTAPDAVGLASAFASLAAAGSARGPLVCVVDDVQWADPASTHVLKIAASRAEADGFVLVLVARDSDEAAFLAALPRLTLTGLPERDARALLRTEFRAPLDERVHERVLAEARGNPLALLELPRSVEYADLTERPDARTVLSARIEGSVQERAALLTQPARSLLLAAATDPSGDPELLRRAAVELGVDHDSAVQALTMAEFLDVGGHVRFRHPLVRSAVYRAAHAEDRRRVHLALADVMDSASDSDRIAWHRAQAATEPDEGLAAALEQAANLARQRAGVAAAGAFLERSAALSPDPARKAERALAAAEEKTAADERDTALDLLATAEAGPLDARQRARAHLARARIAAVLCSKHEAVLHLVRVAHRTEATAPHLASEARLDALGMAVLAGRGSEAMRQTLATMSAPQPTVAVSAADTFLDRLTAWLRGDTPDLREALHALRRDPRIGVRHPVLSALVWTESWEWEALLGAARQHVVTARRYGPFTGLSQALTVLALATALAGDTKAAAELVRETEALAEATGTAPLPHARLYLTALEGGPGAGDLLTAAADQAHEAGEGLLYATAWWCTALLHNSTGEYAAALTAARTAVTAGEPGITCLALTELVEAAVRCGAPDEADAAVAQLTARTAVAVTPIAQGIGHAVRALVADGTGAEQHYEEALASLTRTSAVVPTARAHLQYGAWLRRQGRRQDARAHLSTASRMFSAAGAGAFASQATAELRATGALAVRRAPGDCPDQLTHQEARVAQLAGNGSTSKEIGMHLHLSPRTVDAHLRSIFRKLGITSRRQLRDLAAQQGDPQHTQLPSG